jgi:hypothetical protein
MWNTRAAGCAAALAQQFELLARRQLSHGYLVTVGGYSGVQAKRQLCEMVLIERATVGFESVWGNVRADRAASVGRRGNRRFQAMRTPDP